MVFIVTVVVFIVKGLGIITNAVIDVTSIITSSRSIVEGYAHYNKWQLAISGDELYRIE